ncbi:MAG: 4-alpha-glucanotransferase [Acetobacteraceae bacterium]
MNDEALRDLARRAGIVVDWQDYAGRPNAVAPDVLRRILASLGLPADSSRDLSASRRLLSRKAGFADLPPMVTAIAGRPTRLDIGGNEAQKAKLFLERGEERDISLIPARGRLRVPAVQETGYHRLRVDEREIVLAVAPARCRSIEDVVPDARLWGIAAQVYALRTAMDVGIGDAQGIASLAEGAARYGADALALSPLHALFAADPGRYGPYAPSSRLFLNPLHAAPQLIFGAARVAQVASDAGIEQVQPDNESQELIDWSGAATAKYALLRALFESFIDGSDWEGHLGADFARFRAGGGPLLDEHVCFEALHAAQMPVGDWRQWPTDLRDPRSAAVAAFANAFRTELLFHGFMQWLSARSLEAAQMRAREAGMRIGLIGDVAVGMDPAGSHAWSRQADILLGVRIGAPPDLLNKRGQEWGLTTFSPRALEAGGFAPFIATLRAAMRYTGGVRIDHAMGLARLWLVPEGAEPADGAYLEYPTADLLRLLALESVRHNTVVIGEDLGTVPAGFHDQLEQAGIHGMRVLWFEREANNGFTKPRGWDRTAVAMTSTHDLPTIAGWWHGSDIALRAEAGQLGAEADPKQVHAERGDERPVLWQAFVEEHIAEGDVPAPDDTEPVVDAALRFVARTESPLCLVPVEDLLGQEDQPNVPGTVNEHPNWRRRLAEPADAVLEKETVARRIAAVAAERPRQ